MFLNAFIKSGFQLTLCHFLMTQTLLAADGSTSKVLDNGSTSVFQSELFASCNRTPRCFKNKRNARKSKCLCPESQQPTCDPVAPQGFNNFISAYEEFPKTLTLARKDQQGPIDFENILASAGEIEKDESNQIFNIPPGSYSISFNFYTAALNDKPMRMAVTLDTSLSENPTIISPVSFIEGSTLPPPTRNAFHVMPMAGSTIVTFTTPQKLRVLVLAKGDTALVFNATVAINQIGPAPKLDLEKDCDQERTDFNEKMIPLLKELELSNKNFSNFPFPTAN